MNRITSMEKIIVDNESIPSSDEEMEIEEEPHFSEASSPEYNLFPDTESNKDLSESELSSDDEEVEEPQPTK
jgi:hypothetical protein